MKNEGLLTTRQLRNPNMAQSRLHNKGILKKKSAYSNITCNNQIRNCLSLLYKTKKNYFANINIIITTNSEKLCKTVNYFLRSNLIGAMNLAEKDRIL